MALSINKLLSLNEVEHLKNEYSRQVYFSSNTNDTLSEDTFENKNKKKKAVKIAGWALAVATAVVMAVLYKKGKSLEAGKRLGDEVTEGASGIADDLENGLGRRVKDGVDELAVRGRRAEENASDIDAPTLPRTTKVEPTEPPTAAPTPISTSIPTAAPTRIEPTAAPSPIPTSIPTAAPTRIEPTVTPSPIPTSTPTSMPNVPSRVEPTVVPVKIEPRIFTEDEVKAAVNVRLDRTVPVIPEELKTIKIEYPEFKKNFKELFGFDLAEIEKIPLEKYEFNGNYEYTEELPDGKILSIVRLGDNVDSIHSIRLLARSNESEVLNKELWAASLSKSEMIIGDTTKHTTYTYGDDGLIRSVLVGRESQGTYAYDAEGKLFRILEEENTRMMTQRRIYFDPQTGKIKTIQYFDTTRGGWEGMKADYFDKNGEYLREIFSDDALRIARKKEEINEILKFDKIIPGIPKELETTKLNEQELKMYFENLGISIEEIENIPLNSYKQIIEPGMISERRYVKDLSNGKKLIICRNKENYDEIAYILIKGPQKVESKVIFAKEHCVLLDVTKLQYPWCIYRDSGELSAVYLLDPEFGYLSYNAEGKLTFAVIDNPKTKIRRDIQFQADTGKVENVLYKGKVDGVKSDYLKQEFLDGDGKITAEYFPEDL